MQSARVQSASLAPTAATRNLRSTKTVSSNLSANYFANKTNRNRSERATAVNDTVGGVKSNGSEPPRMESGRMTVSLSHHISGKCSEDSVSASATVPVNDQNGSTNVFEQTNEFNDLDQGIRERVLQHLALVKERHAQEISSLKKKQWCYNCEREAIFYCCWNTAYCSRKCQHLHWKKEHRRVCRRDKSC